MGKIRGDVEAVGLVNLLQMLSVGGCVGVLTVSRLLHRKAIGFSKSGIRLLSTGARNASPLGEALVRSGKMTRPQLEELSREQKKTGVHLGVLAVDRKLLSKEDLEQEMQEQFAEEIYELFSWKGASFEWTGSPGDASQEASGAPSELTLDSDATSVMLQASRLADELSRLQEVIRDVRMVPVRLSEIPTSAEDPRLAPQVLQAILPLIDGRRSISEIIDESRHARFRVLGTLWELVQRGMLEIRDADGTTSVRRRSEPPASPPKPGASILLLIDAADVLHQLGAQLRTAGYEVRESPASGDYGEALGKSRVDAIVLDALVESEEGLERCARLRAATSIPYISFARSAGRETVPRARESGARFVLLMPIREELLLERLALIVRGGA
jgi:CheY-like chemotaxis protein